jgi:hypothetical protein
MAGHTIDHLLHGRGMGRNDEEKRDGGDCGEESHG